MKNEIEVLAVETHERAKSFYNVSEQYAYKFLIELKKIRDEKLFLQIGCSNFAEYTKSFFGYDSDTINLRIQDALNWNEDYTEALRLYGKHKTRQLGLLPEKERENVIENGVPTSKGPKPIEEATTREIEEYKKQLNNKDKQIENLSEVINQMSGQPPEPVIKEIKVETVPKDYEEMKQAAALAKQLDEENQSLKNEQDRLKREAEETRQALQAKRTMENDELEQAKLKRLQRDSDINVYQLILDMNSFVEKQAVVVMDQYAIHGASEDVKKKLTESAERVENLLKNIKREIGADITWVNMN